VPLPESEVEPEPPSELPLEPLPEPDAPAPAPESPLEPLPEPPELPPVLAVVVVPPPESEPPALPLPAAAPPLDPPAEAAPPPLLAPEAPGATRERGGCVADCTRVVVFMMSSETTTGSIASTVRLPLSASAGAAAPPTRAAQPSASRIPCRRRRARMSFSFSAGRPAFTRRP
jgi:hypothetical protein